MSEPSKESHIARWALDNAHFYEKAHQGTTAHLYWLELHRHLEQVAEKA